MTRIDPSYLEGRSAESLRKELAWELERLAALREAFQDLPEVAPIPALHLLNDFSMWPRDWDRGKELQRKHGLAAIPPNSECECGAGLWAIIREALTKTSS